MGSRLDVGRGDDQFWAAEDRSGVNFHGGWLGGHELVGQMGVNRFLDMWVLFILGFPDMMWFFFWFFWTEKGYDTIMTYCYLGGFGIWEERISLLALGVAASCNLHTSKVVVHLRVQQGNDERGISEIIEVWRNVC